MLECELLDREWTDELEIDPETMRTAVATCKRLMIGMAGGVPEDEEIEELLELYAKHPATVDEQKEFLVSLAADPAKVDRLVRAPVRFLVEEQIAVNPEVLVGLTRDIMAEAWRPGVDLDDLPDPGILCPDGERNQPTNVIPLVAAFAAGFVVGGAVAVGAAYLFYSALGRNQLDAPWTDNEVLSLSS